MSKKIDEPMKHHLEELFEGLEELTAYRNEIHSSISTLLCVFGETIERDDILRTDKAKREVLTAIPKLLMIMSVLCQNYDREWTRYDKLIYGDAKDN
jgi:hypothetical protein